MLNALRSQLRTIWTILQHSFTRSETVEYPEQKPYLAPRYRGRIVLTRDPDGDERCVACNLCAVACPVDCIEQRTSGYAFESFAPKANDLAIPSKSAQMIGTPQLVDHGKI